MHLYLEDNRTNNRIQFMKQIVKTETYFYDVPREISSSFVKPPRGIYLRHMLKEGETLWTNTKYEIMENEDWGGYLEDTFLS